MVEKKKKLAYDYILEFDEIYKNALLKAKRDNFTGEDAQHLATRSAFVTIAGMMVQTEMMNAIQNGKLDTTAKELQKRNDWQTARIKQLEEEIAFQRERAAKQAAKKAN